MRIGKSFRRMLAAVIASGLFAAMPLVSAEVKEYEGFGEYVMSDFETPDVAKQRAKARAEQNAMEQAGVYVESYTKVINAQMTHDEITTMTNGILKVKDVQYGKMTPTEDGKAFLIQAVIKADIDTDNISKWISQNKKRMDILIAQNQALKKSKEEQERQIENLKEELIRANTKQEKIIIQEQINIADREFLSNQKVEEGANRFAKMEHVESATCFLQAIKLNPQNALAYSFLGAAYAALGNGEKAIENCNKAIALKPEGWAYFVRAFTYDDILGDSAQAIADYTKAIDCEPNDAAAYINRGIIYWHIDDYAHAISDLTKAIELEPNNDAAYINRGAIYSEVFDDYTSAIIDLTKAIELHTSYAEAYSNRGMAYGKLGDYTKAVADLTSAIEMEPQSAKKYYLRGLTHCKFGNKPQSLIDFTKAIELNPKYEDAYVMRGTVYGMQGDSSKAIIDFTRAIELNPRNATAYYGRGVAYRRLGNNTKATADFSIAKSLGYKP